MLLSSLNNIFQDSFNKILSQQLTYDRSKISHDQLINWLFGVLHNFNSISVLLQRPVQQTKLS